MDLQTLLPELLPRAIQWAENIATVVAERGRPLSESATADARTVGVQAAENIRILIVDRLPLPDDVELRAAALQTGLLSPEMVGLTLGYSILIVQGNECRSTLSHECRHVAQYEQAGSIAAFLPQYLTSIVQEGYVKCRFEREAREYELPD